MQILKDLERALLSRLDDLKQESLQSILNVRSFSDTDRVFFTGRYTAIDDVSKIISDVLEQILKEEN